jgi:hypothetical protein
MHSRAPTHVHELGSAYSGVLSRLYLQRCAQDLTSSSSSLPHALRSADAPPICSDTQGVVHACADAVTSAWQLEYYLVTVVTAVIGSIG